MRSPRNLLLAAGLFLAVLAASAAAGAASIPAPTGPVVDLAGVLDEGTKRQLTEMIRAVREQTTAEIAVLTVPSTAPETIQEYSIAVFDRWKIGQRGQDNGLLFLVAVRDRRLWITTGYGLEGILPDGRIGDIRDRVILPYFRAGNYAEGILRGTEALTTVILGKPLVPAARPAATRSRQKEHAIALGYFMGFVLLVVLLLVVVLPAIGQSGATPRRYAAGSGAENALFAIAGALLGGGGRRGGWPGGWSGGGFSSGGFGGFGGGSSGGGGAGGSW